MSEIRTTSATGGQKGVKPERFDLLPQVGLAAISRVFGFGAEKYDDHNWRLKYEWGKSIASLGRHLGAFANGETYDYCKADCAKPKTGGKRKKGNRTCADHSGLPHLAHAGFHILVLLTWLEEDGEGADNPMDDRWPAAMERSRRLKDEDQTEDADWTPEEVGLSFQGLRLSDLWLLSHEMVVFDETQRQRLEEVSADPMRALEEAGLDKAMRSAQEAVNRSFNRRSFAHDYYDLPFDLPTSFLDRSLGWVRDYDAQHPTQ